MKQNKTTTDFPTEADEGLRPEELIVTIYKKKLEYQDRGIQPERIVMSMESYKKIRNYHAGLGEVQGQFSDYLSEDYIFGIPVFIDHVEGIVVE